MIFVYSKLRKLISLVGVHQEGIRVVLVIFLFAPAGVFQRLFKKNPMRRNVFSERFPHFDDRKQPGKRISSFPILYQKIENRFQIPVQFQRAFRVDVAEIFADVGKVFLDGFLCQIESRFGVFLGADSPP